MIEYVLLWMVVLRGGNVAIDSQTFANKQACEQAASTIKSDFGLFVGGIKTICIPKK